MTEEILRCEAKGALKPGDQVLRCRIDLVFGSECVSFYNDGLWVIKEIDEDEEACVLENFQGQQMSWHCSKLSRALEEDIEFYRAKEREQARKT